MTNTYLVSDTRERSVLGFIESLFDPAEAGHATAQINTGDYLVCRRFEGGEPEILACIERKTLGDFAASFKDGRYENRLKMLDMRDRTGCQLYFFVEGAAFPSPSRKIARIPYSSILSAITNMMICDGIHVVQTANEMGTAQRLLDFVKAFEKTDVPYQYPLADAAEGADGGAAGPATAAKDRAVADGVPSSVLGLVVKSDDVLVVDVWARLTGISYPTAQMIAKRFAVADLAKNLVDENDLSVLRTAGGSKLANRGRSSLHDLLRGTRAAEARVLSGVPGVSPAMADCILAAAGGLKRVLAGTVEALGQTEINQRGRTQRLGPARATRIWGLLHFTIGDHAVQPAAQTAVQPAVRPAAQPAEPLNDDELDAILESELDALLADD